VYVNRLYLKNFRRFEEASFEFSSGNTLILGPNAIGKTTILEAIHILIFGRSFRANALSETIQEGKEAAAIEATFVKEGLEHTLGLYFTRDQKKVRLNRSDFRSVASLIGLLLGTALLPSDINFISGQPQGRRLFLDFTLAQVNPLYVHHLSRYGVLLKNRNALLKKRDLRTIDFFEEEMAKSASYIFTARNGGASELNDLAREQFSCFGAFGEEFSLNYLPSGAPSFLECFQKNRPREMHIGFTIAGPQKDDLELFIQGKECKTFSSEGQKRSAAAAMRLASWNYLQKHSGETPILLVDDAGLGFDKRRKTLFMDALKMRGQVLITSAEEGLDATRELSVQTVSA
jgi:DNA replication and repair protein RecF